MAPFIRDISIVEEASERAALERSSDGRRSPAPEEVVKHIHVSPTIPFTSEIPSEKALESFVSLHRCYETGGDNVERKTEIERERER